MRKWILRGIALLVIAIIVGTGAFVVYWSNPLPASAAALSALQSSANVTVTDKSDQIVFMPSTAPKAGFVFYPGARVAPAAYAVIMHAIAEKGYAVFILKLPINFALLGVNQASGVIAANPSIKTWAVGGHSLGGVAASMYAAGDKAVTGLILYAAYPASDISRRGNLAVLCISGTNDGLATPDKVNAAKPLMPATTIYDVVQGGVHAYFGDYGPQDGDGTPTISREVQTVQVVAVSVSLLKQLTQQGQGSALNVAGLATAARE